MGITYEEIKKRREDVEAEQSNRRNLILSEAERLVDEYRKSLGLEKETWTDISGVTHPYVFTGKMYDANFRKCALNQIEFEANYFFNFTISTVVDDSPRGGKACNVSIRIRLLYSDGTVEVDDGEKTFRADEKENKYANVCEAIKLRVLSSVNDPELALKEKPVVNAIPS